MSGTAYVVDEVTAEELDGSAPDHAADTTGALRPTTAFFKSPVR